MYFSVSPQESLFIANAKTRVRPQERRVFLFEQLLVFSEPFERKRDLTVYIYRHGIKVRKLFVIPICYFLHLLFFSVNNFP